MAENIFVFNKIKVDIINQAEHILKIQLENKKYIANKTGEQIDKIQTTLLSNLRELSPNFKYIISTVILQKTGAGLHSEIATLWDSSTDGAVIAKYENEYLICMCTIIGIAI